MSQGRPAAATAVPFLIMTTDNRLTMYPAPPPAASSVREFVADFGKAKVRDVVVTEAALPLEKWVHVGAEVRMRWPCSAFTHSLILRRLLNARKRETEGRGCLLWSLGGSVSHVACTSIMD